MSIWQLTLREISHRKIHFGLGLLSITVAIAAYIAATMLLRDSAWRDQVILTDMEKEQAAEQQQQFVSLTKSLEQLKAAQETSLSQKEINLESEIKEHEQRLKTNLDQSKTELINALTLRREELEKDLADTQARLRARLQEREKAVAVAGAALQDAMRKITKGLGFNILILSRDQDINQFHLQGVANAVMPEAFVTKLANSKIVTINHLLPVVTKRVKWTEQDNLEVVLIGTRGEVPLAHRDPKKPLLDIVPKGAMIVGHAVGNKLGLKKGQAVRLLGREFKINKVHGERGSLDDSSIWLNLTEAQELLKMENVINAILALECNCATVDRVAEVRAELAGILPGTQIIERGTQALARAEARNKAKQKADEDLKQSALVARKILTEQLDNAQSTLTAQETANEKTINEQEDRDRAFMDTEKKKMNGILEQEKEDNQATIKQADIENGKTLSQQKASHEQALKSAREKRDQLQAQKERFAAILIPLALAAAAIWIGLLTYGNARRRQSEIGILRAIGLRTSQILTLLLGKAFYLGLLGALLGVGAGLALGLGLCETSLGQAQASKLIEPGNLLLAAALAPLIAMLGSWLPAIAAARQDPAIILQEE